MAWNWDDRTERYRHTITGRFLSYTDVNRIVNQSIDVTIANVENLAAAVARGDITVDTWQLAMRAQIKKAYIWQAELAAGGRSRMTPEFWGVVGGRIRGQYKYLDNFAKQLADGALTEGQVARRSRMYISSSRQVYWAIRTRKAKAKKYTEELWTAIGDANTCQACSDADAMGWQPMGTFAEPGSGEVVKGETFCEGLSSCRCEKSYR